MFSKNNSVSLKPHQVFSWILFCSLFTLQCTPKVGEDPPKQPEQKIEGTACLADALTSFEHFAAGEANEYELRSAFGCGTTALTAFKRYVRGRENDRYKTQEIATFIEQNFIQAEANSAKFKSTKISTALQLEVMKIKRLFIGGSVDDLTFPELDQLIQLLSQFENIALSLNPYMKVYIQKWTPADPNDFDGNTKFFEAANSSLQKAVKDFTGLIEKQNPVYVIQDLQKLLVEIHNLYNSEWAFLSSMDKYIPVVQKLKKALAGGDETIVKPTEWQNFLMLAGRGYVQYLRYQYFMTKNLEGDYSKNVVAIFRALEDIFSAFEDMVNVKSSGVVTSGEISEILTSVSKIWPTVATSETLVTEVMKLKQLIFGGSVENWSVKDFKNGKAKLQKIRLISDLLYPYYKIYTLNWKFDGEPEQQTQDLFRSAQDNLQQISILAGEIFEADYKYEDFGHLIGEIQKLYPDVFGQRPTTIAENLDRYRPLFIYFKKRVFSESTSVIKVKQWPVTLKLAQRFFGEYLYFNYFVQGQGLLDDVMPGRLSRWSQSAIETIAIVLKELPQQKLTKDHLVDFLDVLHDAEILLNIKTSTFRRALDFILNHVLVSPQSRLEGKAGSDALTKESLQVLRSELSNWLETEVALRAFVMNKKKISYLGLRENIDLIMKKTSTSASLKLGLSEVFRNLKTQYPMTYNDQGQLIIDRNNLYVFDSRGIFTLNLTRMLSRIIVRSSSESLQRVESYAGITQEEATKVFEPVKAVLIDLGIVSSFSPTFINSRFIEANIFMPNSNGDQLVSYEELSDLLGTVFSGLKVNMMLEKKLKVDCFAGQDIREKVPFSCLSKSYRRHLPSIMTATPQFLDYIKIASPQAWEDYLQGALRGAGDKPDSQGMASMRDVALIPFVIQYIELVFLKHDLNKNNLIEYRDVQAAFPLFEGLLKTLAKDYISQGLLSEDDMFALFCYIINYGAPPSGVTDYLFKWKPWVNSPSSHQKISADRTKIAGIIGYIAEQATAAAMTPAEQKNDGQAF